MIAKLDGRELTIEEPTLASALEAARAAALQAGRVIIEVELDGRPVPEEQLSRPGTAPMPNSEVRFMTAEPRALVRTTMLEIADIMPRLREEQQRAAEHLQRGQMSEAFDSLKEVLGVWDAVRRAVDEGPALLNIPLEQILVSKTGVPLNERGGQAELVIGHIGRLSDVLSDVKASLESQDWSTLSDLLSGELDEAGARWEQILRDMAAHIGQRR
jgi:hypothetical protein